MQLNRYTFLAFSLPLALGANAQSLTLDVASTVPAIGTDVPMHRGAFTTVPAGGMGVLHDFSTIVETGASTYRWTATSISPNAGMFPTANLALNNGGPDTIFYKTSALGFERVGETRTIDVLLANFPAGFTDPVLELPLPLTYNDTWTDGIAGSFDVDGSTGTRFGTLNGTADSYGFVTIPGTVDPLHVLRTTTNVNETINIIPSGFPIPIAVTHKRVEVAYRTLFSKMPVFRTVTDSLISPFITQASNYSEWMDATVVGVLELQSDPYAMNAFPSPADATLDITFNMPNASAATLSVVDARGVEVLKKALATAQGEARQNLAVKTWQPGVYQAVITGADGSRSMKRFVVAH